MNFRWWCYHAIYVNEQLFKLLAVEGYMVTMIIIADNKHSTCFRRYINSRLLLIRLPLLLMMILLNQLKMMIILLLFIIMMTSKMTKSIIGLMIMMMMLMMAMIVTMLMVILMIMMNMTLIYITPEHLQNSCYESFAGNILYDNIFIFHEDGICF